MKLRNVDQQNRGGALTVILISTALLAATLAWGGFAVVKSLRPSGALTDLRTELFEELDLTPATQIQVKAPSLLFAAVRWGSHFVDVEPEVRCGMRTVESAQVGVYELTEHPGRQTQLDLIRITDNRLLSDGYERLLCVLDQKETVLVYLSEMDDSNDTVQACVVVLSDCNLVLTSVSLRAEAISDLVELGTDQIDLKLAQLDSRL
jgi:hypothetical protein